MQERRFTIRTMTRSELDMAVEWAASEGWNPGLHDADCFYAADPEGFLVGCLGDEPVACVSSVKYGSAYAFLGFYIVKPEYRDRRFGYYIGRAAVDRVAGRVLGLDGVVAQQKHYVATFGFAYAHRNMRYEGVAGGAFPVDEGLVDLRSVPLDALAAYDRQLFPEERDAFLGCWISQPEGIPFGLIRQGRFAGYGVARRCRIGYKIGPLFADMPADAGTLFSALSATVPAGEPLFLDIPQVNPAAVELAERNGMRFVFETARMYKGPAPALPLERIFGITTFELG